MRHIPEQSTISHQSSHTLSLASMAALTFTVHVGEPELLQPSSPTPREFKYLSNIDDQEGLRNHIPFVHFYPPRPGRTDDPVPVIRRALSRALVHYYPVAGRLRHGEKGKLVVDCCSEGVVFREGIADVSLRQLQEGGGGLRPPFPEWDRLLVDDIWGSCLVVNSPLLRVQVTRLIDGGFVLAYTFNHCICDAFGALQLMTAVSEFAREPSRLAPTITPAWSRELLSPRSPPDPSHRHPEYDNFTSSDQDFHGLTQLSIFFSRADLTALKRLGGDCPTFDAVASCLWRARTRALSLKGEARLLFPIDTRSRHLPLLPEGYYGAAVVFPCAVVEAADLRHRPVRHAAAAIASLKRTAAGVDYRASVIDFIEVNGRRGFCGGEGAFVVSDQSRLRFREVDFGWGEAVYGGPARAGTGAVPGMVTSVVGYRGEDGEEGLLALVALPEAAVEVFEKEVREEVRRGVEMEGNVDTVVRSSL